MISPAGLQKIQWLQRVLGYAADDAPASKKIGRAHETNGREEEVEMLQTNVELPAKNGKNAKDTERVFVQSHTTEARRMRAWLESRLTRAEKEGVVSEAVTLTPVLAELLLERNGDNRPLRESKIADYATDIREGNWELNGETIKVSVDGHLNDGQHRCAAVVRSGRAIRTVILFGVSRDSRLTVDQGAVRTAGNFLAMEGVPNPNETAAVASLIWQYETHGAIARGSHGRGTKVQVQQAYRDHPRIRDSIKAIPTGAQGVGRSRSVLAFCHYLFARRSRAEADYFLLRLCLGDGLGKLDPIRHCRDRLMTDRKMRAAEKVELVFRTWNASRRGEKAKRCPAIIGRLPALER